MAQLPRHYSKTLHQRLEFNRDQFVNEVARRSEQYRTCNCVSVEFQVAMRRTFDVIAENCETARMYISRLQLELASCQGEVDLNLIQLGAANTRLQPVRVAYVNVASDIVLEKQFPMNFSTRLVIYVSTSTC